MITAAALIVFAFAIGILFGRNVVPKLPPKVEMPRVSSVPLKTMIAEFRDFARDIEGGVISQEVDEALAFMAEHAEQKRLPAKKSKRPLAFPDDRAKDDWGYQKCLEKDLRCATDDAERLIVFQEWLTRFRFDMAWKTWSVQKMETFNGRQQLRELFAKWDNEP